jgi:hypothetical protein
MSCARQTTALFAKAVLLKWADLHERGLGRELDRPRHSRYWMSVASSSDGTKLVALEGGGQIYTSADSGVTLSGTRTNLQSCSGESSPDGPTWQQPAWCSRR